MSDVLDWAMELPGAHKYESYIAAVCPFHDDHKASLMVRESGYKCLACGAFGRPEKLKQFLGGQVAPVFTEDSWEMVRPLYNLTRTKSKEEIACLAHRMLISDKGAQKYLEGRGIAEAIGPCHLGYYHGWYVVPIFEDGEVIDVCFRSSPGVQLKSGIRFFQYRGQTPAPYYPDRSRRNLATSSYLCVVFGLFDAISLALIGHPVVTSTIGKNNFQPEWLADVRKPIIVIPDLGEEVAGLRLINQLDWRGHMLQLDFPENCKDPNDYFQTGQVDLLDSQIKDYIHGLKSPSSQ